MADVEATARFARAPGWWPLLGHSLQLHRDPLRFLAGLAAHGDLVEIGIGPSRAVVVCDPGLAHQVITDLRTFDRVGMIYDRVRAAMGNGLATAVYAEHRRQRPTVQPAFHPRHLPGYAAVMRDQTAGLMARWRDGQCVDMVEEMFRLTLCAALQLNGLYLVLRPRDAVLASDVTSRICLERWPLLVPLHVQDKEATMPARDGDHDPAQAYIDEMPPAHRPLFDRIHALIRQEYPHAKPEISYGMLCWRAGDRRLYLGSWKHGLSIYGWSQGRETAVTDRHPELKTSKGTIRLTAAAATNVTDDELLVLIRAALDS